MKYITDTIKYLKSNLLLLPALAVAVAAIYPILDFGALDYIARSFSDGYVTDNFTAWLYFFLPVNTQNWLTVLLSVLGYVALVVDLSFIHSMIDKHVRFGSKSFRSVMSSFTVNLSYGLTFAAVFAVCAAVTAPVLTAIMKTFSHFPAPYVFIAGIALCAAIAFAELFAFCHFALWLPCMEITGFRVFEALTYSYSLARPALKSIFISVCLPMAAALAVWFATALTCPGWTACVVSAAVFGCTFIFVAAACYLIYADKEGIEREDLKKF